MISNSCLLNPSDFEFSFKNNQFGTYMNAKQCTCSRNTSQGAQSVTELYNCCTQSQQCTEFIIKKSKHDELFLKEMQLINAVNAFPDVLDFILPYAIHKDGKTIIMLKKRLLGEIIKPESKQVANKPMLINSLLQSYIQFNKVAYHRDIKPDNIVYENNDVKFIDFGSCIRLSDKNKDEVSYEGTPIYSSPLKAHKNFDENEDKFAIGCVIYELITGEPLFGFLKGMRVLFFFVLVMSHNLQNNFDEFLKYLLGLRNDIPNEISLLLSDQEKQLLTNRITTNVKKLNFPLILPDTKQNEPIKEKQIKDILFDLLKQNQVSHNTTWMGGKLKHNPMHKYVTAHLKQHGGNSLKHHKTMTAFVKKKH